MATSTVTDWDEIEADPDFSSLPQEYQVKMFDDWEKSFNRTLLEDADLDKVKPEGLNRFAATNAVRRRKLAGEDVSDPDAAAKTWAEQKQAEAKLAQQSLKDYADVEDKKFRLNDARSMPGVDEFGQASPEWEEGVSKASQNLEAAESKFTPEVREQAKAANEALKGERKIATLQGNIYTDPALVLNKDEFRQQVLDSDASPEAKALKLASFQSERKRFANEALRTLRVVGESPIPGAQDFPSWEASQPKEVYRLPPEDKALQYLREMQKRGDIRKLTSAIGTGILQGGVDIATQAVGTAAMLTGDEEKSKIAAELSRASGDIGAAQELEGDMQATGGTFAGGVSRLGTGMAPMLLPGGAVGGVARLAGAGAGAATAAAVGASALTAGAQTAGSQFGEVYDHLRRQGSTHEQAFGVSRNAAVLSGAVTTALTALGGATGVESLLRQGGKDLVKSRLLSALKAVPKGAAAEIAEELPDEYISQLVSAFAKDPNVSPSQVTDEFAANAPDLMLQIAALGGAGAGVGRFRETTTDPAKAREAEFPTAGAPPPLKPQDYENRAAGGQPIFNEEGDVIGVAPPGATPEETAAYREEIRSAAEAAKVAVPEVVEPIDGVDPAITEKMDARLAAGKASGLADQTLAELERQKAAQGAPAPVTEAPAPKRPLANLTDEELEQRIQDSSRLANETAVEGSPDAAFFTNAAEKYRAEKARRVEATTQAATPAPAAETLGVTPPPAPEVQAGAGVGEAPVTDDVVAAETDESLFARIPVGPERDKAVTDRRAAAERLAKTIKKGDKIVLDDGEEMVAETDANQKNGEVQFVGFETPIKAADYLMRDKATLSTGEKVEIPAGRIVRSTKPDAATTDPTTKSAVPSPTAETLGVTAPPAPTLETPEGAARNADTLRQAKARVAGTEQGPRIGFLQPSEVAPATEAPPITPTQETPTPATEGTVMPGGSAMERDDIANKLTENSPLPKEVIHFSRDPLSITESDVGPEYERGNDSIFGYGIYAMEPSQEKGWSSMDRLVLGKNRNKLSFNPKNPIVVTPSNVRSLIKESGAKNRSEFDSWLSNKVRSENNDAIVIRGFGTDGMVDLAKKIQDRVDQEFTPKFPEGKTSGPFINGNEYDAINRKTTKEVTGLSPEEFDIVDMLQDQIFSPPNKAAKVFSPQTTTVATPTETAAPLAEWTPTVNAPAAFTASNGQKLVGTVQSIEGGKAVVSFLWNGNENTQTVPVSQLARPVASLTEPPKYQYTQEQNTRKMGKHFPTAPGVYANYDFRKAFASMAKDTSLSRIYRMLAKVMSKMPAFANMDLHVVADGDVRYAGEYSFSNGRGAIAVNLRQVGRGKVDALGTILHEALHHLTLAKVRNPKDAWENEIIDKLDTIRGRVLEYAQQNGLGERFDYELGTVEEFISAVFTRPDFQNFLASIPDSFAPGVAVGKFRSVLSEVFRRLAELVTGEMVAKGSTMEQAMTSVLALFETPHRAVETGKLEALNAARSNAQRATPESIRHAELETKFNAGTITPEETAEAQRLVDERAKAAGYDVGPVWHASDSMFEAFDPNKAKGKYPEFWFSERKSYAANHGKYNRAFYIKEASSRGVDPQVWTVENPSQIKSADPFTGVPLDQRFDEKSNSTLYSPADDAMDAEYMAAVESGDVAKQQAMVDAAAKAAGYVKVWRGVKGDAPHLEPREYAKGKKYPMAFSSSKHVAESYIDDINKEATQFYILDKGAIEFPVRVHRDGYRDFSKMGFDEAGNNNVLVARQVYDAGPWASNERDPDRLWSYASDIYSTLKKEGNIKSADPVTRDEQGNVIPLSQRFNPKSNSTLYSPADDSEPFYSKLAQVVEQKMPNRADAQTIKGIINNTQTGIKAEEIKWSGIVPWLESQTGPVTKQAVLDYLASDGAVRLEEVRMDDSNAVSADEARQYFGIAKREWDAMTPESRADMIKDASERKKRVHTRYQQYQLPGGENYREVVLAMPTKAKIENTVYHVGYANRDGSMPGSTTPFNTREEAQAFIDSTMRGASIFEKARTSRESWNDKTGEYTSSHFPDVPNYVAHMRMNDRTDAEGKEGAFIEEIQSDRHQAGREKGYKGEDPQAVKAKEEAEVNLRRLQGEIMERAQELRSENGFPERLQDLLAQGREAKARYDAIKKADERYSRLEAEVAQARQEEARRSLDVSGEIPDAPFRTTWPLQMFKRALADAVAAGKQWIGWTTGETQAERYDLSKQVDSVYHSANSDGTYNIDVEKDGRSVLAKQNQTPSQLEELVGKELTKKIVAGEGSGVEQIKRLSGDGLKVGGEGMKGFYDTILPKEIGKYVKQWGASVVKEEVSSVPPGYTITFKGGYYEVRSPKDGVIGREDSREAAERTIRRYHNAGTMKGDTDNHPIWRVDITPQMKAGVRSGQTLFSPADESDASEQDYQRIMARYEGTPRIAFVKKRRYSPIVRDLLNRRKDGENIPVDVLNRAIREYFPSAPVIVPKTLQDIPSQELVERSITSNKLVSHKEAMAKGMPTAGSKITVRQDVPAMNDHGVGVVTTRTENGTFYLPATRFYDPVFKTNERGALNIGLGDNKDSVIAIQGKWSQDQSMPEGLENWTQVGFNPDRHSYYYERGTERQVVGGTEAFQIGNTVFVKNPVFKNVRTGTSYSPADESDQRESDAVFGVMMEDGRFEEGVDMYDKVKRRQPGSPPQPSANTSTPPRFTNSAQFAAAFEAAYLRGDFDYFLEALKQADRQIYVPEMKKYINASKLGYADAAERLEWFRHAIAGTVPPNVKPQTKTPPQPQPSAGAPPPPVGTPPPPPAATPPPKAGVSNRPMLTLNTAAMGMIAKMLGAGIRINTLLRRARGRIKLSMADGSEIELSKQLFKDPVQAAKTLAHEIGHLFDFLPASGFNKSLAHKLAPLGDFRKVFGNDLADWFMDGGKKIKPSKITQLIKSELVTLSKKWRGDFSPSDKYRGSGKELYADFISAILNDPMWTAKNAPYATVGFLNALEQKREVDQAYQLVVSLVQGGSLYKALAEANRGKSTTALERLIAKSDALTKSKKIFKDAVRGLYRSMFGSWLPTAIRDGGIWKSYWKRLKNMGTSGDYNWAQEEASQFAVRHITQFDNDMAKAVGIPLKLAGIDPDYLQRLQTNNRIIHERRRVGKLIEEDPVKARQLLKWMVDAGLLGKDVQDEVDATPDDGLYKKTAEVIYKLHASGDGFEQALKAARRKSAPADAEKALYAFDVSGFMLNPDVFTMESAEADNADIEKTLGPDQFGELERINEGYHDLIKRTMVQAYKMGLFRQSTWDDVIVPNFGVYVPFMPIKYFTGYVKGGVGPSRVGTANDLMAPHVVGIRKMHALINRMQRQKQALLLIDVFNNMGLHNELEPVEDENFDRQKAEELVKQSKNTISYVSYWDQGEYKWVKVNGTDAVPLVMNSDPDDLAAVYQLLKANTRLWRMNFTIFSIAFNVANTLRNVATPSVDVGAKAGYKAAKELLSVFPQMGKWVWAKMAGRDMASIVAASISIEHAMHKPGMPVSAELQEFYDRGILQPSPDVASLRMTQEELARSVIGALSSPELLLHGGHKAAKDLNWFDKTLKQYFYSAVDALSFLGSVSEAAPKIAAYKALKEKRVPEKITVTRVNGKVTVTGLNPDGTTKMVPAFTDAQATYLATLEGIPRPGVGGSDNALWEMVLLFFRIMGQSWRKHLIMATAPQTRAGFLMRHMLFQGAKFGLQAMAANGVIDYLIALGAAAAAGGDDDDIEKYKQVDWAEAVSRQSDHKLSRGGVGPLICWVLPDGSVEPPYGHKSIPADWVPFMPRLPGTEFSRELDPMSYYATSKTIAPTIAPVNDDVFWNDYLRGLVSLNPAFEVVSDAMSIVGPTPPRDSYRGREKVEQRVWDEGYIARMLGLGEHHLRSFGVGSNPYDTPLPGAWNVLKKPGFKTLISTDNMVGVREERRARREDDLTSSFAQNMVGEKFGNLVKTFNRLKGKATPRTNQEEEIYSILKPVMSKQFYGTQKNDGMYDVLQSYARMKAQDLQDTPGGKLMKAEADQTAKDLEQTADDLQKTLEYLRTHTLP